MREVTITSHWEDIEPGNRIYIRDTLPVDNVYLTVSGRLIPKRCFRWSVEVGDLVKVDDRYGKVIGTLPFVKVEHSNGDTVSGTMLITPQVSLWNAAFDYLTQKKLPAGACQTGMMGDIVSFTSRTAEVRVTLRNADDFLHFQRLCDA